MLFIDMHAITEVPIETDFWRFVQQLPLPLCRRPLSSPPAWR